MSFHKIKKKRSAQWSSGILLLLMGTAAIIPEFSEHSPQQIHIEANFASPSQAHILGTDENGRDVFVRLMFGGRISLGIGLCTTICSAVLGTFIGACSGYFGRFVDSLLMRFTDMMLSLPVLPLLLILAALDYEKQLFFGYVNLAFLGTTDWGRFLLMVCVIASFSWMQIARLVRAEVLSLKTRPFIQAMRVLGAGHVRILLRHVIPNVLTPVFVASTLSFGGMIQYEAVLSFLGLGMQASSPSWGNMLANSIEYLTQAPVLFLYPGVLITVTVLSVNILGDALREILDEKHSPKK